MDQDEKLLLARIRDLEQQTERNKKPCFSRFLDPKEIAQFLRQYHPCLPYLLWGGYEDAERKMLGFFPDFSEPNKGDFPLCALRVQASEELGHRTVLGSLMGLGIERTLLGDVAKEEDSSVIFVCDSIAEFLQINLTRAGRTKVTLSPALADSLRLLPKAWEAISGTVASLRLDCVLGLLLGSSRSKTEELLKKEAVSVNFSPCTKGSLLLGQGDVLSIRGFGRAEVLEIGGETRKGRMKISIKKYI